MYTVYTPNISCRFSMYTYNYIHFQWVPAMTVSRPPTAMVRMDTAFCCSVDELHQPTNLQTHDTERSRQRDTLSKSQEINNNQCFFFSRNIGQLTPKIIYFHYVIKYFLDQSIQKIFNLTLKTEALTTTCHCVVYIVVRPLYN